MTHHVVMVVGTRPEIIKASPIIRECLRNKRKIDLTVIHTGQHYDKNMSSIFFKELDLPPANYNIGVGSGTPSTQSAKIMTGLEAILKQIRPDIALAIGDTNTVAMTAIVCSKCLIPFGHVEAGLRSYDKTMPEEINRRIADICADLHFCPTHPSAINLLNENVPKSKIYVTGNTIVDACNENLKIALTKSDISQKIDLKEKQPIVTVTVHRQENVDNKQRLKSILRALTKIRSAKIILPLHPRARKMIHLYNFDDYLQQPHIEILEPLGYLDFLNVMSHSSLILTDSGGIQEEATCLKIPCLTLRDNTERPESLEVGINRLVGTDERMIINATQDLLQKRKTKCNFNNPFGDGKSANRIVSIIYRKLEECSLNIEQSSFINQGKPITKTIVVPSRYKGWKVEEMERELGGEIVLIYDKSGNPHYPFSDRILREEIISIRYFTS